jgi:TolA-binding protein
MSHDDDNVGVDELAALAKQIDLPAPDEQRVELMRSSLLRAAGEDRREPRARWPFVAGGFTAGALAAAAAAIVVLRVGHAEPPAVASHEGSEQRAQIEASSAADFERTVTHGAKGNDEVVRLHAGRISLAVADLPTGDRVRVAANNGEIEGSGLYEVAVVDDAIREVKVKEGSARVRLVGSQEVFLATGQVWKAPLITADLAPTKPPREDALIRTPTPTRVNAAAPPARLVSAPPVVVAPAPTPTAPAVPALQTMTSATPEAPPQAISQIAKAERKPVTALEQHFAAGWSLLRANKPAEAARELAAAAEAGGDDPLAGDARYFEAVALTKAGRKTEAEHALIEFMDRSPHAVRRGRAAVMLGRLIAERGDASAARPWFESASHDPDPNVAAAAAAGLK